jgi:hypothetical protein
LLPGAFCLLGLGDGEGLGLELGLGSGVEALVWVHW